MTATPARILIADDHPLFRRALAHVIADAAPGAEIAEAGDIDGMMRALARQGDTDLVLLDLVMPGARGFSGLMYLRAERPEIPVIVVSAIDDPAIMRFCIDLGASGFVLKTASVEAMRDSIRKTLAGDISIPPDMDLAAPADKETTELARRMASLTSRQVQVLALLSAGLLNKQIAHELNTSQPTVKAHVGAILAKLRVESRTQAVIAAAQFERLCAPGGPSHEGWRQLQLNAVRPSGDARAAEASRRRHAGFRHGPGFGASRQLDK